MRWDFRDTFFFEHHVFGQHAVDAAAERAQVRIRSRFAGELKNHDCLSYRRPRNGQIRQWRFARGKSIELLNVNGFMTFNSGEALISAAVAGRGLIQVAEYYAQPDFKSGRLVEALADYKSRAYDISVVFQQRKRMAPRLRVFIDFMIELFDPPPWATT